MKTLTLRLTAPLQSYGNQATFERRTSGDFPSKSAVIGMIAAALGYRRDDDRILALNDLVFAVRVDQGGKPLTEFQTVEWKQGTRKLTHRDYLQDAVFMVAVGSEDEATMTRIHEALQHPKFQLFLGRRASVPAGVLQIREFADQTPLTVLKKLTWQASCWYQKRYTKWHPQAATVTLEMYADAALLPNKHQVMVRDRVESFDQRDRRYGFRPLATERVTLPNPLVKNVDQVATEHDPFSVL